MSRPRATPKPNGAIGHVKRKRRTPPDLRPLLRCLAGRSNALMSSREIPHRFLLGSGDPDGGELACAMQAGERLAIPAVGLHPISGLARDERGGDDSAIMAQMGQLPVDPIAAGAGLVTERQHLPAGTEFLDELHDCLGRIRDLP